METLQVVLDAKLLNAADPAAKRRKVNRSAPITSTVRDAPSEVIPDGDDGMKSRCAINLHNKYFSHCACEISSCWAACDPGLRRLRGLNRMGGN
jgi:hypothetical protein